MEVGYPDRSEEVTRQVVTLAAFAGGGIVPPVEWVAGDEGRG